MPTRGVSYTRRQQSAVSLPYVEPITLVPRPDPFDDPEWIFEPKYDGFRGLAYSTGSGCEIRSRRDIPLRRFDDLWGRLAEVLRGREAILDGEIVALDRKGKPVFDSLVRGQGFIAFAAFDLLWLDGQDLRGEPLVRRKELLGSLLPEDTGPLYKVLAIEEHGRALFGAARRMDLGGIVAKRKADRYEPGTVWYRIANSAHRRISVTSPPGHLRPRASHSTPDR
jgi:bifunctional non-homologous end joining protein LigD